MPLRRQRQSRTIPTSDTLTSNVAAHSGPRTRTQPQVNNKTSLRRKILCRMLLFVSILLASTACFIYGVKVLIWGIRHNVLRTIYLAVFTVGCAPLAGCTGFVTAGAYYYRQFYWGQVKKRQGKNAEALEGQEPELIAVRYEDLDKALNEVVVQEPPLQEPSRAYRESTMRAFYEPSPPDIYVRPPTGHLDVPAKKDQGFVRRWSTTTATWMRGWDSRDEPQEQVHDGFEMTRLQVPERAREGIVGNQRGNDRLRYKVPDAPGNDGLGVSVVDNEYNGHGAGRVATGRGRERPTTQWPLGR